MAERYRHLAHLCYSSSVFPSWPGTCPMFPIVTPVAKKFAKKSSVLALKARSPSTPVPLIQACFIFASFFPSVETSLFFKFGPRRHFARLVAVARWRLPSFYTFFQMRSTARSGSGLFMDPTMSNLFCHPPLAASSRMPGFALVACLCQASGNISFKDTSFVFLILFHSTFQMAFFPFLSDPALCNFVSDRFYRPGAGLIFAKFLATPGPTFPRAAAGVLW